MAITEVASQVTTKRLFNIVSGGQQLMRSVYYSRQTSTKFLWQKQKEVLSRIGSVSWRWSSSSRGVAEESTSTGDLNGDSAPPAVHADSNSYGVKGDNQAADSSLEEFDNKGDGQEGLQDVGYDMSKVSKPAGDE
uniref:Uncharacterized protein n=1 Tax=Physcomitrium patens TaxID=3218 RepID=A9U2E8_PHYPA|nr:hypothetical protein PHYPA_012035 [Physcomitrium patens]